MRGQLTCPKCGRQTVVLVLVPGKYRCAGCEYWFVLTRENIYKFEAAERGGGRGTKREAQVD